MKDKHKKTFKEIVGEKEYDNFLLRMRGGKALKIKKKVNLKEFYEKNYKLSIERAKLRYYKTKKIDHKKYLKILERNKNRYIKLTSVEKLRKRQREKEFRDRKRLQLLRLICGNDSVICKKCGFDDIRALQIDHVHGGGNKEKQMHGLGFYNRYELIVKASPNSYQILCANCNWIKRAENGECGVYDRVQNEKK